MVFGGARRVCVCPSTYAHPRQSDNPAVEFSVGAFDVLEGADDALRVGVEYCGRPLGAWALTPAVGFSGAADGSNFVYADLRREFWFHSGWVLNVAFGAGRFKEDAVLDLGASSRSKARSGSLIGCPADGA